MSYYNLTKWDVKEFTLAYLLKYSPLTSLTIFTPVQMLLSMILLAAVRRSSLEQVAHQTPNSRCGKTLRDHLRAQLSPLPELESSLQQSFFELLPNSFSKKRIALPLSVDWIEDPYYGKSSLHQTLRRSKPKSGTSRFFIYASLYTILKGRRHTLAVTAVTPQDNTLSVLKRLHSVLLKNNLRAKYYLLDRQFYSVSVIQWLKKEKLPFIIPAVIRGNEGSGTRRLNARKSSKWENYTIKSGKGEKEEVEMAIVCFNKKGKKSRKTYVYATWGMKNKPLTWIKETYRKRFGIEVSYRQRNEFEIKTTTQDDEVRYFYMVLGFLMRNVWVWLHWNVIGERSRGRIGKRLKLGEMTIDYMKGLLRSAIEEEYPIRESLIIFGNGPPEMLRSG